MKRKILTILGLFSILIISFVSCKKDAVDPTDDILTKAASTLALPEPTVKDFEELYSLPRTINVDGYGVKVNWEVLKPSNNATIKSNILTLKKDIIDIDVDIKATLSFNNKTKNQIISKTIPFINKDNFLFMNMLPIEIIIFSEKDVNYIQAKMTSDIDMIIKYEIKNINLEKKHMDLSLIDCRMGNEIFEVDKTPIAFKYTITDHLDIQTLLQEPLFSKVGEFTLLGKFITSDGKMSVTQVDIDNNNFKKYEVLLSKPDGKINLTYKLETKKFVETKTDNSTVNWSYELYTEPKQYIKFINETTKKEYEIPFISNPFFIPWGTK